MIECHSLVKGSMGYFNFIRARQMGFTKWVDIEKCVQKRKKSEMKGDMCTSQQKVDTSYKNYTHTFRHNTLYTVLESDSSMRRLVVLH
jgi:hypothetical protein